MIFGQFSAAAPEITLLTLICVVLITDLFVKDEQRVATFWLSMASLVILFVIGMVLLYFVDEEKGKKEAAELPG